MRIAVFDYFVEHTSPSGKCLLHMVEALADSHQVVVFANRFQNARPDRVRWVHVPVLRRPLLLLYMSYHLMAVLAYWWFRVMHSLSFDAVQMVESNLLFGDVVYAHFCHRAYLRSVWPLVNSGGVRARLRWANHYAHALVEPLVMSRARCIVVPSAGLATQLAEEYGADVDGKIQVIPNPVDVDAFAPDGHVGDTTREQLGFGRNELVLVFVALGNFEHKGLPQLLAALRDLREPEVRLLVVGGTSDLVASYRETCHGYGLEEAVTFVARQEDVRPFLWASDAFVLPSAYETFSLVTFEAAAAGLPLLVTPVHGVEEFVRPDYNGWFIERSEASLAAAIQQLLGLPREQLRAMGNNARESVARYSVERFQEAWRQFYAQHGAELSGHVS